jgi:hypothetical protein
MPRTPPNGNPDERKRPKSCCKRLEVWLLPSPKAAPPAPVVPQPVRPHPDIEEVQLYVTEYSQRKDEMITKYRKLKAQKSRLSQQEFERLLGEWTDDYSQWADDLKGAIQKGSAVYL